MEDSSSSSHGVLNALINSNLRLRPPEAEMDRNNKKRKHSTIAEDTTVDSSQLAVPKQNHYAIAEFVPSSAPDVEGRQ
jgi:hypothetical protein